MRRFLFTFAIASFALFSLPAQDLNKILNDHYKASAGEKMSKITSITTSGKNKLAALGMETGFTLYQSRPNKIRIEADFAGQKVIQTYNGTTGWMYAPSMGIIQPQQMGVNELKSVLDQAEMDSPLWDYKAKGKRVELAGDSEDGSSYVVKVISSGGDELTVHIDKGTSLISRIKTIQMANGKEGTVESELKDYKVVKGIPTPFYMAIKLNGMIISTLTIESVEYDKAIDASIFEKPVVE